MSSRVSLRYDKATNRYVSQVSLAQSNIPLTSGGHQMAIFQYRKNPEDPEQNPIGVSNNNVTEYPLNTQLFSNINTSFNPTTHEIELPKGNYIIQGFFSEYLSQNRWALMKVYIRIESPSSIDGDYVDTVSSTFYHNSSNSNNFFTMQNQTPWITYINLLDNATIQVNLRYEAGSNSTLLGLPTSLTADGGIDLPEVYGTVKFIKI